MANFYEVTTTDGLNVHLNIDAVTYFKPEAGGYFVEPQELHLSTASFMSALAAADSGVFGFSAPAGTEEVKG